VIVETSQQQQASVHASDVVLAGAAYLSRSLNSEIAQSTVTALTYIAVTEPLGEHLRDAIRAPHTASDDRFALNYFRPLPDTRLLWGGFCRVLPISKEKLKQTMHSDLVKVFPQLADAKIEHVWGGPLAYGRAMMPMIGKQQKGLWYLTGFGGHGIVPTTLCGELIAAAIASKDKRYKVFQHHFPSMYSGWPLGPVLVQLQYWHLQVRDAVEQWLDGCK